MATFTQNLTDLLVLEGIQPSTKWGAPMTWGTDLWGAGGTNFKLPTVSKIYEIETPTATDAFTYAFIFRSALADNITAALASTSGEYLIDTHGYYRVFGNGATNNNSTPILNYTKDTNASVTWTQSTNSSTSWVSS